MNWIEITAHTTSEGVEAVSELLYQVGIKGLIIDDPKDIRQYSGMPGDWDYVDESLFKDKGEEVLIKGYLPDELESRDRIQYLRNSMTRLLNKELEIDLGSGIIEVSNVKEEDWANNWKKYYKPHKVGKKIVIKPSWEPYDLQEADIVLELDPGMAFGTGTHETTTMCIELLEDRVFSNTELLDVGCGTGVLAIASLLLGARSAVAVDIDSNAVRIAQENAEINQVSDRISILRGNFMDEVDGKYDVVVANIIADAIIEISQHLHSYLEPEGVFIASGIILDRIHDVEDALKVQGFNIIEIKTKGEWVAIVSKYE